jgi:hypothetical protein
MLLIWAFALNSFDGGKVLFSVDRTWKLSSAIICSFLFVVFPLQNAAFLPASCVTVGEPGEKVKGKGQAPSTGLPLPRVTKTYGSNAA